MIRTADRKGNIKKEDSFQNNLLEKIYGSVAGRMMIRPLVTPAVSTVVGKLLDSRISAAAVEPFIRLNHLDMSDYETRKYISYNDFSRERSGRVPAGSIWNLGILSVPVTAGPVYILWMKKPVFISNRPDIQWRNF